MKKQITVIIGTQWGDEGKGKLTDVIAQDMDYVVRFHGGNNAGHTIIINNNVYKLHLLPSGVISSHIISIIANGVVVDPKVLLDELSNFIKRNEKPKLFISQRANLIMPYHIAMDEALSNHQNNLSAGSTKRGIAPVYADKAYRHGIRVGDLLEPEIFKEKLDKSYKFNIDILKKVFNVNFEKSQNDIYKEYLEYGEKLREYIYDTELKLYEAYKENKKILFEGAQGMSLDLDHGLYPHTTSSNNVAGYSEVGSGLGMNCRKRIIGIMKSYVTRVGNSPFVTELLDETGEYIREKGLEYGTTTKRPRRIGWLDLVQIRQSIRTSGITDLAITKLDILSGINKIKICTAYKINNKIVKEMPASLADMRIAEPIYTTLDGWGDILEQDKIKILQSSLTALPQEIKNYIDFIEQQVGCKISIISFGPDRADTAFI